MGRQTKKIVARLNKVTKQGMVELALGIHGELVVSTPVDTGWARANWVPSVGTPKKEIVGSPDNPDNGPASAGQVEVISQGAVDKQIHITNNVPYILALNGGSSKQAPKGFIEKAIRTEVEKVNRRHFK